MSTFGHIDYDAKLDFNLDSMEEKLKSKAFKKRWLEVLRSTDELLRSSRKVDSQKLNDRFGS
jgi:hypothetical protein